MEQRIRLYRKHTGACIHGYGNILTCAFTAIKANTSHGIYYANSNPYTATSDGTTVMIAWATSVTTPFQDLTILVGTSADPISFAETDKTFTDANTVNNPYNLTASVSTAGNYVFASYFGATVQHFVYWLDSGSGFGASTTIASGVLWVAADMTAVWIGSPFNTWGVSGNNGLSDFAQFWNPLFGGTGKGPRSYAYIGNAPFGLSR